MKRIHSSGHVLVLMVIVFIVAFAVRLGFNASRLANLESDPDAYRVISQTLIDHGVYGLVDGKGNPWPTAFRPPLYPAVLSLLSVGAKGSETTVAILHAFLAAWTAALVYVVCYRFSTTRAESHRQGDDSAKPVPAKVAAIIASILFVFDPILLQQSTFVMTETMAALLVMATVWSLVRAQQNARWIWLAGACLSLAYLCRPTFLVWGVLLASGWWIASWKIKSWETAFGENPERASSPRQALILLAILAATVLAWTVRNVRQFGSPIWATTHGGYTLLLGNNPMFYDYLRQSSFVDASMSGQAWDTRTFFQAYANRFNADPTSSDFWQRDWSPESSAQPSTQRTQQQTNTESTQRTLSTQRTFHRDRDVRDDQLCGSAAKALIRREPAMFVYSSLVRLVRVWSPIPHSIPGRSDVGRYAVCLFYLLVYSFALSGFWQCRKRWRHPLFWSTISLIITLSIVHSIYWSNLRMRGPVMPLLAVFAAYGLTAALDSVFASIARIKQSSCSEARDVSVR